VPLPTFANKRGSVPFPCQHHACGCQTADQCWKSCCCYSSTEKLAWAHEHGVAPPPELTTEVAESALSAVRSTRDGSPKGCCSEHADHGHGAEHEPHDDGCCDQAAVDAHQPGGGMGLVIGPLARQCRGMVDLWCLAGAVEPPPAAVDWQFDWVLVGWLAPSAWRIHSNDPAPPVPPPKV
jgi:hypothetical protein